ncbi:MAG: NAD(P)/FAD-dependent oxidoreductase [Candidatus ainarchaeum sp.]|nr:NAD(P)/FAD-dependent oxidoreductase [Candidatus ainarchaeum sp.]MDD3975798.1 NAD(P)/FAD-dependent oxidoreductase [Candidatus ainarchaeum sp.]
MIRGIEKRIIIVGAGPIGLYCAYLLKKNNPSIYVSIFEKNSDSGENISCGGLISKDGFNNSFLSKILDPKDFVINNLGAVKIYSPYKFFLDINSKKDMAYVIDRDKFDKILRDLAKSVGVEINYNCIVEKIYSNNLEYKDLKTSIKKEIYFDVLVGADGPNSIVRKSIPFNYDNSENIHAYQVLAEGNFNSKKVFIYLGAPSKSFFSWIIPINKNLAKIGVGSILGQNPKEVFSSFISKRNILFTKIVSESSGIIPISKPFKNYVFKNKIIIGDSAFFVKATTGGGINFGLLSCEYAQKAIYDFLKYKKPLSNYNILISKLLKELKLHYKIKKYIFSKTDPELEDFIIKLKSIDLDKFLEKKGNMDYPSLFFTKLFLKPKIFKLFPEIIKFFKSS